MIHIDKYETTLVKGKIVCYAIKGKQKYLMPEAYSDMYDNDHLAIEERTVSIPELFDAPATHYIPLYTGGTQ